MHLAGVGTLECHELGVVALFNDAAIFHHQDAVCRDDRRQAMGDDDGGATTHCFIQCRLHKGFIFIVQMARGLVQNHEHGVFEQQTGDCQTLFFATRESVATFADDGLVSVRQRSNRVVDSRTNTRSNDVGVCGAGPGVTQVGLDAFVKQVRVLRHHANCGMQ